MDEYSDFENCLIYCDAPYKGTKGYKTEYFNRDKFWLWCRDMSKKNVVFVSEYEAPDDFIRVWQGEVKTILARHTHKAIEKLFMYSILKY